MAVNWRKVGKPAATTPENPIVNDPEAAATPATTPERATERPRYSRSRTDQEWEAAEALAAILHPDDSVKRDDVAMLFVQNFMAERGHRFSERGFLERIWRDARVLAGLDPLGKPGAKKNSTQRNRRTR